MRKNKYVDEMEEIFNGLGGETVTTACPDGGMVDFSVRCRLNLDIESYFMGTPNSEYSSNNLISQLLSDLDELGGYKVYGCEVATA